MAVEPANEGFPFTLNGSKLFAPDEKTLAQSLLQIAYAAKTIQRTPESYRLFSIKEGASYKLEDTVDLKQNNEFIAEPIAPTPVAGE